MLKTKPVATTLFIFFLTVMISYTGRSEGPAISSDPFTFNVLGFLAYEGKISDGEFKDNAFKINRAYLTVKKNIFSDLSVRFTLDAYQDAAKTSGNEYMRVKYFYADYQTGNFLVFSKSHIEGGIVHTSWLDFEEGITGTRMQGSMFAERAGLFGSADFGLTAMTNLGGEIDENYRKTVSSSYPGRYGSISLGVYNGGGYGAVENNYNKTIQARLSIRPIPDIIPGLQFSWLGAFGKGNTAQSDSTPDWTTNLGMVSYESENLNISGQYFAGKGNAAGTLKPGIEATGYSIFALGKLNNWRVLARYDNITPDKMVTDKNTNRIIMGLGYDFGNKNILLLDFDKYYLQDKSKPDDNRIKLTMQVNI